MCVLRVCVCLCAHMHVYVCVCVQTVMRVYACVCVRTRTCMCICVCARTCMCVCVHTHACVCVCVCVCVMEERDRYRTSSPVQFHSVTCQHHHYSLASPLSHTGTHKDVQTNLWPAHHHQDPQCTDQLLSTFSPPQRASPYSLNPTDDLQCEGHDRSSVGAQKMAGLCERPSKAVSLPAVDDAVEKTLEGPQNGLEQGQGPVTAQCHTNCSLGTSPVCQTLWQCMHFKLDYATQHT